MGCVFTLYLCGAFDDPRLSNVVKYSRLYGAVQHVPFAYR